MLGGLAGPCTVLDGQQGGFAASSPHHFKDSAAHTSDRTVVTWVMTRVMIASL